MLLIIKSFFVEGEYTIQHAPAREVSIIGMENVAGSISSVSNGATSRAIINIMWCELNSGNIDFNHDYFELNASGNTLSGSVTLDYGKVIGNNISGGIELSTDALIGTDSVHIVGNNAAYVNSSTTAHYVYISNNYLTSTVGSAMINLSNCKNGVGTNVIRNNSLGAYYIGIRLQVACSGNVIIYNNLIYDSGTGDYGIWNLSSATLIASFNYIDISFDNGELVGFANDGTNVVSGLVVLNGDGSSAWPGTIDGGTPGLGDYDLDLTRNDPGCFGGSYSHENFFPIDGTSSRVYYLQMPSQILVGGTNAVTGHSFDR